MSGTTGWRFGRARTPPGLETTTAGGRTYYKYHTTVVKGNGISLTYDEDYYPITGFTQQG